MDDDRIDESAAFEDLRNRQTASVAHNGSPNGGRLLDLIKLVIRLNRRHSATLNRVAQLENRIAAQEGICPGGK